MKLGAINPDSIKLLGNDELLNLYNSLRSLWQEKLLLEKVVSYAYCLRSEIESRKLDIEKDAFLEELNKLKESGFTPVYPSGQELGKEINLDEIKQFYSKPIKLVENAVNIVGGLVIWGKTKNDFEQLIRIPPREELIRRIIFRLDRAIPDRELRKRAHMLDDFWGPFTDSLSLYDLCLVPSESTLLKMAEVIQEELIRAKSPKAEKQAKKAQKSDKITLGEFFFPLKSPLSSLMGYRIGEKYSVDAMIDYLRNVAGRKELKTEIVPSFIQKKYDGLHCLVHKISRNEVIIFSDDGSEITHRLPKIEKELKEMKPNEFILDTELESWKDKLHQSREDVAAYIHRKDEPDDSDFLLNCFDLLWLEKKGDIHKLPVSERIKLLNDLDFPQSTAEAPDLKKGHLNLAPTSYADTVVKLRKALIYFSKSEGSEGAMVKYADMTYELGGSSTSIVKLKTYAEVHGIVWRVNTTKIPTVFNYDFAIAFSPSDEVEEDSLVEIKGKKYSKAGRSYDTSTKCEVGDIITIKFHTVNKYKDPETGKISYHFYEPVFYEKRDPGEEPDSFTTVERIGEESGLMREKAARQRFREQADPFMHYPSEDKTYTGIWQHHARGKSIHVDQRNEGYDGELIGWTINDAIEGAIKEPILTLKQLKELDKQDIFKINYQTGEWKKRLKKGAVKPVDVQIVSEKKAPEPHGWHDIEGVVKPGEVGATKEYPGVFTIMLKGPIEYGSQKSWSHEYFYHIPPIDYRIVFRRLKLPVKETILSGKNKFLEAVLLNNLFEDDDILDNRLQEAESNPEQILDDMDLSLNGEFMEAEKFIILPAKEKGLGPEGVGWVAIKPVTQEPYVLSSGAVKKNWLPPLGISALPKKIRKVVPDNLQYWKAKNIPDALKLRLELVNYFKEKKIDFEEAQIINSYHYKILEVVNV